MSEATGEGRRSSARLIVGCGLGCLAVFAIVIVLGGLFSYYAWQRVRDEFKPEMAEQVRIGYEEWLEEHEMPAEYAADFEALIALTQEEETSFWAVMMIGLVVENALEDDVVTPEEAREAADLVERLRANPDMGVMGFQQYMAERPELQGATVRLPEHPETRDEIPPEEAPAVPAE